MALRLSSRCVVLTSETALFTKTLKFFNLTELNGMRTIKRILIR